LSSPVNHLIHSAEVGKERFKELAPVSQIGHLRRRDSSHRRRGQTARNGRRKRPRLEGVVGCARTPIISRMECIESCGMPKSTARMPVLAEMIGLHTVHDSERQAPRRAWHIAARKRAARMSPGGSRGTAHPMVEPHGQSLRTTNSCGGASPARRASSRTTIEVARLVASAECGVPKARVRGGVGQC
jgi:hypothetical protein